MRVADELDEGYVVFMVCDGGCKYPSSAVCTRPIDDIDGVDSTAWA